MSAKILVTGFEPFGSYRTNITAQIIHALPQSPDWQAHWRAIVLPVRFEPGLFLEPVQAFQPDYVLGLGQYPRGRLLRLERRAHNHMKDRHETVAQPISQTGPDRYAVSWKIRPNSQMRVTYDAGSYVCNYAMYQLSAYAQGRGLHYAFVHIPRHLNLKQAVSSVFQILKQASPV